MPIRGVTTAIDAVSAKISSLRPPTRVAVLGAPRTGKTTLLSTLGVDDSGQFRLVVAGKDQRFTVADGLDGMAGQNRKLWQKAFTENSVVLYLFRADLVAERDSETVARLREDMQSFRIWLKKDSRHPPRVVLIGTHADSASSFAHDLPALHRVVESNEYIRIGSVHLDSNGLIVGSLLGDEASHALIDWLAQCLE